MKRRLVAAITDYRTGFALLALSLFMIAVPYLPLDDLLPLRLASYVGSLGHTLLPTVIVGYTLNFAFNVSLAQDAFYTSLGYVLPQYLRDEIRPIYSQGIVAVRCNIRYGIEKVSDDTAKVTLEVYREFRNETASGQPLELSLASDEWNSPIGKTQILEFSYQHASRAESFKGGAVPTQRTYSSVRLNPPPTISLGSGEEASITFKAVEFQGTSDQAILHFTTATLDPVLEIQCDPLVFGYHAAYSAGGQREPLSNVYKKKGVLLPGQYIRVRWWPKETERDVDTLLGD